MGLLSVGINTVLSRSTLGAISLGLVVFGFVVGCGGNGGGPTGTVTCGNNFAVPNYASLTDPSTSTANFLVHWASFPLKVYVKSDVTKTFSGVDHLASEVIDTALQRWSDSTTGGVNYTIVSAEAGADIVVTFRNLSSAPTAGQALGVTTITYVPSTGQVTHAAMTINLWTGMTSDQFFLGLPKTVTHEFGHAIFISGHSPFTSDIMYWQSDPSLDGIPTNRDQNTIVTAYCGVYPNSSPLTVSREKQETVTIVCPAE